LSAEAKHQPHAAKKFDGDGHTNAQRPASAVLQYQEHAEKIVIPAKAEIQEFDFAER